MTLAINENWQIAHDKYNWTLRQRCVIQKGKNAGKVEWDDFGYYANLDQLAEAYASDRLKAADPSCLEDVRVVCEALRDEIRAIARALGDGK